MDMFHVAVSEADPIMDHLRHLLLCAPCCRSVIGVGGAAEVTGAFAGPATLGNAAEGRQIVEAALANNNPHTFF